jgi:hypothetical protein
MAPVQCFSQRAGAVHCQPKASRSGIVINQGKPPEIFVKNRHVPDIVEFYDHPGLMAIGKDCLGKYSYAGIGAFQVNSPGAIRARCFHALHQGSPKRLLLDRIYVGISFTANCAIQLGSTELFEIGPVPH